VACGVMWRSVAGSLALFLGLTSCTSAAEVATKPSALNGVTSSSLSMIPGQWDASTGESLSTAELLDQPLTIVFFGFTNCDDLCPLTLNRIAVARRRLPAEQQDQVRMVLITTDPARDTPEVMAEYLGRIDPEMIGITAPGPQLHQVADAMGVFFGDAEPGKTTYQVDHSTPVLGLQESGPTVVWVGANDVAPTSNELAEDFAKLLSS
jgi:protein SCO1